MLGVNPNLKVGDEAPDFELESDNEGTVRLSDYRGRGVVLYFYPKDMTPGCTTQACDFRDRQDAFVEAGYKVFGVSPDPVERHAKFREKHDLNFALLADKDHIVSVAYGVWREKTNYGKKYMGIVRSTFVIDAQGLLLDVQDNVRAKGHAERILGQVSLS